MSAEAIDPIRHVANQSAPLEGHNAYLTDRALQEAVEREGAGWAAEHLTEAGAAFAQPESYRLAELANTHRPVLRSHDRQGRRIDAVDFHDSWHALLDMAVSRGLVALPWVEAGPGAQAARAALHILFSQTEVGTECPVAMSFGAVPVLRSVADAVPEVADVWLPRLLSGKYDPRPIPAEKKTGVLLGMGMTERQGGSDVRANITRAEPIGQVGQGRRYRIVGHKWFFSAPMCDGFLILARTGGALSCFLVPRLLLDGRGNSLHINRLKDKCGNHSNASAEVELHGAIGILLGEEGRGVRTIIEMAAHTRLDCVLATTGMQRRALAVALNHAAQREAFGAKLIEQPIMRNVLADLAIESEAATALALALASTFETDAPEETKALGRLLTPAAKLHICKRGAQFAAEAMEVLGGNGYVEENEIPRLYREMPLLSIWEGSGNVMCLDVLRAASREPETVEALAARLGAAKGADARLDAYCEAVLDALRQPSEPNGRSIAHGIVLAMQGAILVEHAPAEIADTFCATRLSPESGWGASFGTLPDGAPVTEIIERAFPAS